MIYVRLSETNKNINEFIVGAQTRGLLYIDMFKVYWSLCELLSPVYNRWYNYEFYGWVDDITSFEVDWSHGADLHM